MKYLILLALFFATTDFLSANQNETRVLLYSFDDKPTQIVNGHICDINFSFLKSDDAITEGEIFKVKNTLIDVNEEVRICMSNEFKVFILSPCAPLQKSPEGMFAISVVFNNLDSGMYDFSVQFLRRGQWESGYISSDTKKVKIEVVPDESLEIKKNMILSNIRHLSENGNREMLDKYKSLYMTLPDKDHYTLSEIYYSYANYYFRIKNYIDSFRYQLIVMEGYKDGETLGKRFNKIFMSEIGQEKAIELAEEVSRNIFKYYSGINPTGGAVKFVNEMYSPDMIEYYRDYKIKSKSFIDTTEVRIVSQ